MLEELKKQPVVVFYMAVIGWTAEKLKEADDITLHGAVASVMFALEDVLKVATADMLVAAANVAKEVCGETPVGAPVKKESRFEQRLREAREARENYKL